MTWLDAQGLEKEWKTSPRWKGIERPYSGADVVKLRGTLPIELPMAPDYAGCKSWVELEKEIPLTGAVPVLDQPAFDHKLQQFFSALNPAVT